MSRIKAFIAPILASVCWSMSYIMTNVAFKFFSPITIIFFRVVIASLFMLLIALLFNQFNRIKREHLKWFLLLGAIEPFSYFLFETFGLTQVSSTLAAVILSTIPLFSPIFSNIILKERITWANILGLIVSVGGVFMIILDGRSEFYYNGKGLLLLSGAVLVAITYSLYVRRLSETYSEITIVTSQNIVGVFLFLPLFLIVDFPTFQVNSIAFQGVLAVVLLGVFASALAFIFYAYSLKHNGIVRTNAFLNLLPAMTAILAFLVLGDNVSSQQGIGIGVVIIGLYINQIKKKGIKKAS